MGFIAINGLYISDGNNSEEIDKTRSDLKKEDLNGIQIQLNGVSGTQAQLIGNISEIERSLSAAESKANEAISKAETLDGQIDTVEAKVDNVQTQLSENIVAFEQSVTSLGNAVNGVQAQLSECEALFEEAQTTITGHTTSINNLSTTVNGVQAQLSNNSLSINNLSTTVSNNSSSINSLSSTVSEAQSTIASLSSTVNGVQAQLSEAQSTIAGHTTSINNLSSTVNGVQSTLAGHTTSINTLLTKLTDTSDYPDIYIRWFVVTNGSLAPIPVYRLGVFQSNSTNKISENSIKTMFNVTDTTNKYYMLVFPTHNCALNDSSVTAKPYSYLWVLNTGDSSTSLPTTNYYFSQIYLPLWTGDVRDSPGSSKFYMTIRDKFGNNIVDNNEYITPSDIMETVFSLTTEATKRYYKNTNQRFWYLVLHNYASTFYDSLTSTQKDNLRINVENVQNIDRPSA